MSDRSANWDKQTGFEKVKFATNILEAETNLKLLLTSVRSPIQRPLLSSNINEILSQATYKGSKLT